MEEINKQDENQGMITISSIEVIRKLRTKQDCENFARENITFILNVMKNKKK